MVGSRNLILRATVVVAAFAALLSVGCSSVPNGFIGVRGVYNYSPSVIQTGDVMQFWWCGQASNPANPSQDTDTIQYASVNIATKATQGPMTVMAETPGAWDSTYTCNPKVIEGTFVNPLGDGKTYTYALYYVAIGGNTPTNSIGVAFSTDGIHWAKYPQPIILASSSSGYGVGQPVLFNVDHKSEIKMFYEDWYPAVHHVAAISSDGVHFTIQGTVTTMGLDPNYPDTTWGDMAYDPMAGNWYALFNEGLRDPSTTGNLTERGSIGVELYKIPDNALLTGSTSWQQLHTVDTNATGFESNFLAAIVHDAYGNVTIQAYPSIMMYVSVSYPQPAWNASPLASAQSASPQFWLIGPEKWTPNNSLLAFYQYFIGDVHEATTGWIDPSNESQQPALLGHLYESPQQGASVALYGCKQGNSDYFVSLDPGCEQARILGVNGYAFSKQAAGQSLIAVYRCSTGHDHFVSTDPKCKGQTTDEFLGYIMP